MDHPVLSAPSDQAPVDEAALEAFIRSEAFGPFLEQCFAKGVREAGAEAAALKRETTS